MILWVVTFIVVVMLSMIAACVWKDASKEARKGLRKQFLMFLFTSLVLSAVLGIIVFLF